MADFFAALKKVPDETMRDYFEISLYTGARKSNVLAMRWEDVDLDLAIWRIPMTKNKESHLVPLTGPAVEILRRRSESGKTGWVFPGRMKDCHLVEPKRVWYKLIKDAGVEDLRVHDLRRTLASYMAITNHSLPIIARALGHKSTQSTQIYSRLTQDPVRNAMDIAITQIRFLAQSEEKSSEIVIDVEDSCA
jgi:integrase